MLSAISSNSSQFASPANLTNTMAATMHQKTGAPVYACKQALALSGNNMPAALTLISKASPQELLTGEFAPKGSQPS